MRLAAVICLLFSVSLAGADEPEAPTFTLGEQLRLGWHFTDSEVEAVSSSVTFHLPARDGSEDILHGGVNERHERSIRRTPLEADDHGPVKMSAEVLSHRLERTEMPPGEGSFKITHNGPGPITGAQWHEEWRNDHWRHLLTREATSEFGRRPDELRTRMLQRRYTRSHFMLPTKAVAVGESWKPDASQLLEQLSLFARDDAAPRLEIECRLESVDDSEAVISMTFKLTGTQPAKSASRSEWSKDTRVTVEGSATLRLDRRQRFVLRYEARSTIRLNGEIWNAGSWLRAQAVLATTTSINTRAEVAE